MQCETQGTSNGTSTRRIELPAENMPIPSALSLGCVQMTPRSTDGDSLSLETLFDTALRSVLDLSGSRCPAGTQCTMAQTRDGAIPSTRPTEAVMRDAIPPPSGSHRLGSFAETNKTATTGNASGRLSSARDKATWYHTERTVDLEPSNIRNRDQCRRGNF